jgi:hypothetical protein
MAVQAQRVKLLAQKAAEHPHPLKPAPIFRHSLDARLPDRSWIQERATRHSVWTYTTSLLISCWPASVIEIQDISRDGGDGYSVTFSANNPWLAKGFSDSSYQIEDFDRFLKEGVASPFQAPVFHMGEHAHRQNGNTARS